MKQPSRWSAPDDACTVEISAGVLAAMIRMADEAHPLETGTSLYGGYSDQRRARVEGIAPLPQDSVRERFNLRRGVAGLASFFRRLFAKSKGESFYVGEFHTHPGGAASPSLQDDTTQFAIATDTSCQCEAPILVIIGGAPEEREVGVFVYTRAGGKLRLTKL